MTEYRIEYSVQRSETGEEDFTEIGFGSSGTWSGVNAALNALEADVQHRQWETTGDMPDPASVDNEEEG